MSDQLSLPGLDDETRKDFPGLYIPGVTRDADPLYWSASGLNGPAIAEFLNLHQRYALGQAIEISAAMICLDVLAQDISKAKLRLKKRNPGKDQGEGIVEHDEHKLAELLALEPNRRHTWIEFVQMVIYHLAGNSNAYIYVKRSITGDVLELIPLPRRAPESIDSEGNVWYDVQAVAEHERALLGFSQKKVHERDMIHIRQRVLDGFWGASTLVAGSKTLTMAQSLEDFEEKLFSEDALQRGFFSREAGAGKLDEEPFRRMLGQLKKVLANRRNGTEDPLVLEDGIKWVPMAQTAQQAEMAKALDKAVERICHLWRIPPHKAMHLNAVKYENLVTLEMMYERDTLIPIAELIEQRMKRTLLNRKERLIYDFEFDRDAMSMADQKIENELLKQIAERGGITLDEWRAAHGWNPLPNGAGKVRVLPVNTTLIDEHNKVVATGHIKPASESQEPADEPEDTAEPAKKGVPDLRVVSA